MKPIPLVLDTEPPSIGQVFLALVKHPGLYLGRRWNWKSALLSAIMRGSIFFSTNVAAGFSAAMGALALEFALFAAISGFSGALIQSFRRARPAWAATLTVMVFLPLFNHSMEFLVHWFGGTQKIKISILISGSVSIVSAAFNLFIMRRGTLIVGGERQSLLRDLYRLPGLFLEFTIAILGFVLKPLRCNRRTRRTDGSGGIPMD